MNTGKIDRTSEQEAARRIVESTGDDIVSYSEFQQILQDTAVDCHVESINEDHVFALLLDAGLQVGQARSEPERRYVAFVAWLGDRDERIRRIRATIQRHLQSDDTWLDLWFCRSENIDSYEDTDNLSSP